MKAHFLIVITALNNVITFKKQTGRQQYYWNRNDNFICFKLKS